MSKFYPMPTPEQQTLDKAMARAQSHKSSKSFVQWLSGLFNAANRSRRAENRRKLARGNVDEQ